MGSHSLTSSGKGPSCPEPATILVIEDDEPVRALIRRMLECEGFAVIEAPDGLAGLSLIDAMETAVRPIDLVVTDFDLPGIRGDVIVTLLRHHLPELPLLCISGDPEASITAFAHQRITHFLAKPFSSAGLIQHVRALLAAAAAH